jgi:DNA polymerase I-like protein with 3'-5' exonuclease and polymerase domains
MDPATAQKLIFVHDSILIEANLDHLEETALRMAEEMRFVPFETDIPLDVDIKVGMKWGSLEKFVPSKVAY